MRLLRFVVAGAVMAVAFWTAWRFAYQPWRCSVETAVLNRSTEALLQRPGQLSVPAAARENVNRALRCLKVVPADIPLHVVAANNYMLLEDHGRAAEMFASALRYDRRPELYFGLGRSQFSLGHPTDAFDNFVLAGLFDPYTILEIPSYDMRGDVENLVVKRRVLPWRE